MARQSRVPLILLTRPAEQSARFAAALRARHPDLAILTSPLLAPRFLEPAIPPGTQALILTSETGAQTARRLLAHGIRLPNLAFCVGNRTAQAARDAGFTALSAEGDAQALIALILAQRPQAPLLHLHGRETRGNLAETLTSAGIETFSAITYDQIALPLTPQARDVLCGDQPVLAPVFSPRSAALLAQECAALAPAQLPTLVAISAAAARSFPTAPALIADRPEADAMLEAISSHLATLNPDPLGH